MQGAQSFFLPCPGLPAAGWLTSAAHSDGEAARGISPLWDGKKRRPYGRNDTKSR